MTTATEIEMVPVDAITVLNPRARNRRVFDELITSIAHLGLKKPITVAGAGPGRGMTSSVVRGGWKRSLPWGKPRSRRSSSRLRRRTAT